ncbi:MAG: TRAP transporter small permease subunit [Proteobacteria bacterium]|nr:TRAP transporter small permease subunit [Pseudomonadota bacterium]
MLTKIIRITDKVLTFFENWTLFLTVMVGLISLFANVVLRYGFNYSLAWSEELIREIIMYTTFIGCSAAIKNRNMITIDALPQVVSSLKTPLLFFSHAATLVFSVLITVLGVQMAIQQSATHQETIILRIPLEILYMMLPLMGVMMFLRTLQIGYEDVQTIFFDRRDGS